MSLFEIIKALQSASGSKAKQSILEQHKDNELLKVYMKATYDPAINYYQKAIPKRADWDNSGTHGLNELWIAELIDQLSNRKVTGNAAKTYLGWFDHVMHKDDRELLALLISRSIGAGVGDTMVLQTWPELFFTVPYSRCSLLDAKAKAKFETLPLKIVQEKCDGAFLYLMREHAQVPQAITRAGGRYPQEFAEMLAKDVPSGYVLVGELLVVDCSAGCAEIQSKVLDRQTGNGICNSILKGGTIDVDTYDFKMVAWDCLEINEFKAGKSDVPYIERLKRLDRFWKDIVETSFVKTMEEAYAIYSNYTSQGKEGAVLKNPAALWSDGTSKDMVKMKIEFEIDLLITGLAEGTGKASKMLGALQLSSSCGKLVTDVGTGFTDEMRKVFWMHKHDMVGKIVTIKANDIIAKRGSDTFSCFLPVFLEERLDKSEANSYDECVAILNSAKGLR